MTTRVFVANGGNDRLIISTICTHLVFFHEAGFEYRTERKQRLSLVLWNPVTWRGFKWTLSDDAEQPRDIRCTLNQGGDPVEFGATSQSSPGFFKLSCEHLSIRRHCVWVVAVNPKEAAPSSVGGEDARKVREVLLRFNYDGEVRTLRHSTGSEL